METVVPEIWAAPRTAREVFAMPSMDLEDWIVKGTQDLIGALGADMRASATPAPGKTTPNADGTLSKTGGYSTLYLVEVWGLNGLSPGFVAEPRALAPVGATVIRNG
jgi:hypothetical protein